MFNARRTEMASGDIDDASTPASLISAVAESASTSALDVIQRALASNTTHLCNHAVADVQGYRLLSDNSMGHFGRLDWRMV